MINAGTGLPSLSAPSGAPGQPRGRGGRRARLWWALGGIAALLLVVVLVSALVTIPYRALSPGSVWETDGVIRVEGATTYDEEGGIGFTTVSVSDRRISLLEAAIGWLDPSVAVVHEDVILGDQTPEENREHNRQLMANSQDLATAVALEALGYQVIECNGGQVLELAPGLPAERILARGDVIWGVEGQETPCWEQVVDLIGAMAPGEEVTLVVDPWEPELSDADQIADRVERSAVLAPREEDPELPILGVSAATRPVFDFPFSVTLETGEVGGPSAGLAFTLAILETLTPESLTGGRFVATTGTIDIEGGVGQVGGVPQKTVAALRAGVDLFIVPSAEYDEALAYAGDMQVEPADTVEEALAALESIGGEGLEVAGAHRR